jgi:hypothetical protein
VSHESFPSFRWPTVQEPGRPAAPPPGSACLSVHLNQARAVWLEHPDPQAAGVLAAHLGQPALACALSALNGGLRNQMPRMLAAQPAPEEQVQRLKAQPLWQDAACAHVPGSGTDSEMYTRVLASWLRRVNLNQAVTDQGPPAHTNWSGGIWRLPSMPEAARWHVALDLIHALPAAASTAGTGFATETGSPERVTWCVASWGGRWGVRQRLREAGVQDAQVISLEELVTLLSASAPPELDALADLLSRPLLLEGLHTLSTSRFQTIAGLLSDAASLFGWPVLILPTLEQNWPASWTALNPHSPEGHAASAAPPNPALPPLIPNDTDRTLPALAQRLSRTPGDHLVVLYSRASAARLCALLPGSVLLSSSLSRVHLDQRMSDLAAMRQHQPVTVIATTLPSTPIGTFDHVWHILAPLPHLVEAQSLSHQHFHLMNLRDVTTPELWHDALQITVNLLETSDALIDPKLQRLYFDHLRATEARSEPSELLSQRDTWEFSRLTHELNTPLNGSIPVLIPFDEASRQAIDVYSQQARLTPSLLRYAAWLTPMEASEAIRRQQARSVGAALIWQAPYDSEYGLAAHLVAGSLQDED